MTRSIFEFDILGFPGIAFLVMLTSGANSQSPAVEASVKTPEGSNRQPAKQESVRVVERQQIEFFRESHDEETKQEEGVKKERASRVTLIAVGITATAVTTALIIRALKKQHKPMGIGLPDDFPNPPGD